PGGAAFVAMFAAGDLLFFFADAGQGTEPYVSDGSATGTFRLADIAPGSGSSVSPLLARCAVGRLDASGQPRFDFVAHSGSALELWGSDGTVGGTRRIAVLATAPAVFGRMVALPNGRIVFPAGVPSTATSAIWS